MKKFIAIIALFFALSSSSFAQLNVQKVPAETILSVRGGWAQIAKLNSSDTYVLYLRSNNQFDGIGSFVLGKSKESAVATLKDLLALIPLKETMGVTDAMGKQVILLDYMGTIAFSFEGLAGQCFLGKGDINKFLKALQ